MFAFSTPLFWYKLVFAAELMLAEGLATYSLKKRNHFALRVVLGIVFIFACTFFYPLFFSDSGFNAAYMSIMFLLLFVMTLFVLKFCYDEKFPTLLFCGVVAYTTQHISYMVFNFLTTVFDVTSMVVYEESFTSEMSPLSLPFYIGAYGIVYIFVWAVVEHKMREQEKLKFDILLLVCFIGVLLSDIVLNMVVVYCFGSGFAKVGRVVIYLYGILSCSFAFGMLYSVLGKRLAETELKTMESLWRQDRKSYEISRENIEQINIKCHDLKHQIRKLKTGEETADEKFLSELENSIVIYDNQIKTGSEALDLILAENSIYMAKHDIRISVIADGQALSFMSDADIYSLFGNTVHNAMEASAKHEESERRVIRLHVRREKKMLVIHAENPCENVTMGKNGLPLTNKCEPGHGYGMRSMRLIAEKYGGFIAAEASDGTFFLDIMIPIPDQRGNQNGI